jgi:hypothetical protein
MGGDGVVLGKFGSKLIQTWFGPKPNQKFGLRFGKISLVQKRSGLQFGKRVGLVNGFKLGLDRSYFLFGLGCKLVFQIDSNWFKLVQTISNCLKPFETDSN